MSNTALLTGASGFVGSHLCRALLKRGWRVKAALRDVAQCPDGALPILIGDIDDRTEWTEALTGIDVVFHLAARVHVMQETAADPSREFERTNVHGTERLAQQAASVGVRQLVYISSIGVNGNESPPGSAFTEQCVPQPHNAYAQSKLQAELVLRELSSHTDLVTTIVRPPLVYGVGALGNFATLLRVLDKRLPLPLSSVCNRRSFVYVENLVDALITCATHPAAAGQTYLVSDGEDISTPEFLRGLGARMGRPAMLFPCPPRLLEVAGAMVGMSAQVQRLLGSLQIDSGKIRRELNWTPPYTLQQGLQETAEWYRDKHL